MCARGENDFARRPVRMAHSSPLASCCVHIYLCTYISTYIHIYLCTYMPHTYIHKYILGFGYIELG